MPQLFPGPRGMAARPLVLPAAEKGLPSGFHTLSPEEMHWSNGPWPSLAREQAVPNGGDPGTPCFIHLSAWAVAAACALGHVGRSFSHVTSSLNVYTRIYNVRTPSKFCTRCQQSPAHIPFGVDRSGSPEISDVFLIYTCGPLGPGAELLQVIDITQGGSYGNSLPRVPMSAHREGGGKIRGVC